MDRKIGNEEINIAGDSERNRKGLKQLYKGQTCIEGLELKRQTRKQIMKEIEKDSNNYKKDRHGQKYWD